jgi:hypothetical protein
MRCDCGAERVRHSPDRWCRQEGESGPLDPAPVTAPLTLATFAATWFAQHAQQACKASTEPCEYPPWEVQQPLFFFALLSLVAMAAPALASDTYVDGHYRSNGTSRRTTARNRIAPRTTIIQRSPTSTRTPASPGHASPTGARAARQAPASALQSPTRSRAATRLPGGEGVDPLAALCLSAHASRRAIGSPDGLRP